MYPLDLLKEMNFFSLSKGETKYSDDSSTTIYLGDLEGMKEKGNLMIQFKELAKYLQVWCSLNFSVSHWYINLFL